MPASGAVQRGRRGGSSAPTFCSSNPCSRFTASTLSLLFPLLPHLTSLARRLARSTRTFPQCSTELTLRGNYFFLRLFNNVCMRVLIFSPQNDFWPLAALHLLNRSCFSHFEAETLFFSPLNTSLSIRHCSCCQLTDCSVYIYIMDFFFLPCLFTIGMPISSRCDSNKCTHKVNVL